MKKQYDRKPETTCVIKWRRKKYYKWLYDTMNFDKAREIEKKTNDPELFKIIYESVTEYTSHEFKTARSIPEISKEQAAWNMKFLKTIIDAHCHKNNEDFLEKYAEIFSDLWIEKHNFIPYRNWDLSKDTYLKTVKEIDPNLILILSI